ncbi:hypothetical protein M3699_15140 [Peribacillus simplex]|uniref:hypothetical protein n=1 Tax=Peribacillus simplex TaxID=1478 RepID=UPI00203A5AB6|nr:hypothetical protein [Peribacillus simplex]MCM3675178.1 hypothetical protein [Peribacillus simplex]
MNKNELINYWRKNLTLPNDLTKDEILNFWTVGDKPYTVRVENVKKYSEIFKLRTLIETGTYYGEMVQVMINQFDKIISVELDEKLFNAAAAKFSDSPHVTIVHGDSGKVLPKILENISVPCLFWLDGHYIPGTNDTARGDLDTPIMQELDYILTHPIKEHVILIDDARCFIGPNPVLNDYPTIQELENYINNKRPDLFFEVKDDIIRIHKHELFID